MSPAFFFMRIGIVSGSGICIPLLYHLKASGEEVELYFGDVPYTDKDRDAVPIFCSSHQVKLTRETQRNQLYDWLETFKPDVVFVSGYSHKIDVKRCRELKHGIYNIHFGKLPGYRGPNPVFWQLKNGDASIGMCIHELTRRFDAGPIVWQQELNNEPHFSYTWVTQVFSNLQVQGVQFLLSQFRQGRPVDKQAQDEKKAGYQKRPLLNDVLIQWQKMKPENILHLVKACNSWNYGAMTAFSGMEVKILDATISDLPADGKAPGTVIRTGNYLTVTCSENKSIDIGFLSINGVLLPARHSVYFSLTPGQRFTT
jgi:methionyl-tRNA formyltransferase